MKFFLSLCFIIIVWLFALAAQPLLHSDALVHTDIARDFLVMKETVITHKPPLIGPKTGGIDGVFHGPLWYWANLPAFVAVGGNPVGMSWFWLFLAAGFVGGMGIVAWKLTNDHILVGMVAVAATAMILPLAQGFFNPSGAVLLVPFFFFSLLKCLQEPRWSWAILVWLLVGCLIQFEMAFGLPIFILSLVLFVIRVAGGRKWPLLLSPLVVALPLATFFLFDLRHDFLQSRAALKFLTSASAHPQPWLPILELRLRTALTNGWNIFAPLGLVGVMATIAILLRGARHHDHQTNMVTRIFLFLYIGFWLLTLKYSGEIWAYYTQPFVVIALLVVGKIAQQDRFSRVVLLLGTLAILWPTANTLRYTGNNYNSSSWKLLSQIAEDALRETPDAGYFLYSQDQYAYQLKYAFTYWQQQLPNTAVAYAKRPTTLLVMGADDPRNPFSSASDWKRDKVKITRKLLSAKDYPFGYRSEIYQLTSIEQSAPADSNLIKGLEFR